jgi:hypothetical protein
MTAAEIQDKIIELESELESLQWQLQSTLIDEGTDFDKNVKYATDVHTEHCCFNHGCKYSNKDCTVKTGKLPQSFGCFQTSVCYESAPGFWDDYGY